MSIVLKALGEVEAVIFILEYTVDNRSYGAAQQ
jgi:hypothetical protein